MMPRMSGAELLARIRAERLAEDTPIIVVTAAAESARSVLRDPVCILGKPLDIGKLLAAMDELA
jgi:CheY-like chemotaxis protein